jgi:hypothetical protein
MKALAALICLRLLFLAAHEQMVIMGATLHPLTHRQQQDTNLSQGMALPQVDIFFDATVPPLSTFYFLNP